MNHGMTIGYLKCSADLNFEVDFRANSATKWDLILFGKWVVFIHNIVVFQIATNMPLTLVTENIYA